MGTPGGQRACIADGAAGFRADYLLLLRRLCGLVPGPGCPAVADIARYTLTFCPKSFSATL